MSAWLSVVGMGEDGLDGLGGMARAAVEGAELLVGGARHLAMLGDDQPPRLEGGDRLRPLQPLHCTTHHT